MRREAETLAATLGRADVYTLGVEAVAAALGRKAAIDLMLAALEPKARAHEESQRRVLREREEREREEARRREEDARQVEALRAAVESDPELRREVERRNMIDRGRERSGGYAGGFGPLPGGFDDSLRPKL